MQAPVILSDKVDFPRIKGGRKSMRILFSKL